ncbi:photosystem II stability/assembly factor-like uncharacterized protein [Paenibacillus cellulosilyticus]|uniref:Photosystem II stability/assembly factor-like uncharacterized protein n=2 Tax=Paenibacillus cellulosilyticus TaxID=375489 RepID=A0A2V2YVM9_9BACL|nr:photosystem II stability/assembly factor-like uncharacterized protein [Paenibacillus cellulosilyticus]
MKNKRTLSTSLLSLTIALSLILSACSSQGGTANSNPSTSDNPGTVVTTPSDDQSGSATGNGSSGSVDNGQPSGTTDTSSPSTGTNNGASTGSGSSSGSGSDAAATPISTSASTITNVTALRLVDANSGWLGGSGQIAFTKDGGKTWKVQYRGSVDIHQIFALNASKVWAVLGSESSASWNLISSTDGGAHWKNAGTVPGGSFLHFTSDKVGFSGSYMTEDGGATWKEFAEPANIVGEAYYHDAANGWAVQFDNGKYNFLHTSDGGVTWTTVMSRTTEASVTGSVIRSAGANDAWIELKGESGMTQTSYVLFHTTDGGKNWLPAVVHNTAGAGPAPGFTNNDTSYFGGTGSTPGELYVVNSQIAYMGGRCMACDNANTIMETTDGGKTWAVRKDQFTGYGNQVIAATDAKHLWLITNDFSSSSVLYTTADGGKKFSTIHKFAKPKTAQ